MKAWELLCKEIREHELNRGGKYFVSNLSFEQAKEFCEQFRQCYDFKEKSLKFYGYFISFKNYPPELYYNPMTPNKKEQEFYEKVEKWRLTQQP